MTEHNNYSLMQLLQSVLNDMLHRTVNFSMNTCDITLLQPNTLQTKNAIKLEPSATGIGSKSVTWLHDLEHIAKDRIGQNKQTTYLHFSHKTLFI